MLVHWLYALGLCSLGLCSLPAARAASADQELYFLSVGISNYALPEQSAKALPSIPGANFSARRVADLLSARGAKFGLTLRSDISGHVTRNDILSALDRVVGAMRQSSRNEKVLLAYVASHGISEGFGWHHFTVPGDFSYEGNLQTLNVEGLAQATLAASEIVSILDKAKVRYLLLLDSCYEGEEAQVASRLLNAAASKSIKDVASIIRHINEFRQGNPVIFATPPGTLIPTVPNPMDPGGLAVGPLARRMMLTLAQSDKNSAQLSVGGLVTGLISSELDRETAPATTHAIESSWWKWPLLPARIVRTPYEVIRGTGAGPSSPCCPISRAAVEPRTDFDGLITIVGGTHDYVTEGRTLRFEGAATPIQISTNGVADVTIHVGDGLNGWQISLSIPDQERLSKGHFPRAERHGFARQGRAGIEITGAGRGCNEVRGTLSVEDIEYNSAGELTVLAARIEQFCDTSRTPLIARLSLKARAQLPAR